MNTSKLKDSNHILAHRGLWNIHRQNSYQAISDAFSAGYGVETDIRLYSNEVVLSHDPVDLDSATPLQSILTNKNLVALNIKSDGLLPYMDRQILDLSNYFFFDGSIPEIFRYKQAGLSIACRLSEFEPELPWTSPIIWLDSFLSDWWNNGDIISRLTEAAFVVVVSPELHGRDHREAWETLAIEISQGNPNLAICTDLPDEFEKFTT